MSITGWPVSNRRRSGGVRQSPPGCASAARAYSGWMLEQKGRPIPGGAHGLLKGLHRADTVQEKKERLQQICLRRLTEERKHELGQRKSLNRRRRQWRAAEAEGWHGLICGSPGGDRRTHGSLESQPPSYRRLQNQADHIYRLNSLN